MSEEKHSAIEEHLKESFPDSQIDQENISTDQHFIITLENKVLMLKVSREFIEDNSKDEIVDILERWDIVEALNENYPQGILVTTLGPRLFKRS